MKKRIGGIEENSRIVIFLTLLCVLIACDNQKTISHIVTSTDRIELFLNGTVKKIITYDSIVNNDSYFNIFNSDEEYLFDGNYQVIKFNSNGNFDTIISGLSYATNNVFTIYDYADNKDKNLRYMLRLAEKTNDTLYKSLFTYVYHNDTIEYKSKIKTNNRILQYWKNRERILNFYMSPEDSFPVKYQKTTFDDRNRQIKFLSIDSSDKKRIKKFQIFWIYDEVGFLTTKIERNHTIEKDTKKHILKEIIYTGFYRNQPHSCNITNYEIIDNVFKQNGITEYVTYCYTFDAQKNWTEKDFFDKTGVLIRKIKREIFYE